MNRQFFKPRGLRIISLAVIVLLAVIGWQFITLPGANAADSFRFVVMADSRGTYAQGNEINKEVLEYINSQIINLTPRPDFLFFLGDMATVAYDKDLHRLLPDWKAIMQSVTDSGIKLYVAIGNHELYDVNGNWQASLQAEFQAYFSDMPNNGPSSYSKLAYSFEHGNSLFIVLDTYGFKYDNVNWDNGIDELQYYWFYAEALKSKAKHKFVLAHGPAFSTEGWPVDASLKRVWDRMKELNFDIYFCGHEHLYSRWNPDGGKLVQIITGSAGAKFDNPSLIKVDPNLAHVFWDYNFVVADVNGDYVSTKTYAVRGGSGSYSTTLIDSYRNFSNYLPGAQFLLMD